MNPSPSGNSADPAAAAPAGQGEPLELRSQLEARTAELAAAVAHLSEQNRRFLTILDAHPERISVVDPATHEVLFANRRYRDALGRDPVGHICHRELHGLEAPCDFCQGDILKAQPGLAIHWERHDEKSGRDYEITDILIPWTDGRPVHYQLSADCSERKRLQRRLEQNLQELARSNGELEQFAYLASHDLQEPLRKIQSFGDRLVSSVGPDLDERSRDHLARMIESARRMQQLINDLLTYSRVGMQAPAVADVDTVDIARQVLGDLEVRLEQCGGTVDIGALPPVEMDPVQLRLLLQNLVGNALKFHRPDVPPVVTIRGAERNGEVILTVADNGIGFDEKYRDRIFRLFQRLHTRQEYDGTGLGLAVCEKIVQRHGGTIAAAGRPGEGATFTVRLPRRQAAGEG